MNASISAVSYYLPEYLLSNEVINEQFPEWSVDKISSKTGIHERRIAAKEEFSSDMAVHAAEKLFSEHSIDRGTVDFLVLCTQSPDYFLPTTACILQERLGLSTSIGAFDFNLGCSGFVYGLGIAKGLIAGGMARNVLLITSETYSKFIHPRDKSNLTIFGDAAAATLITADEGMCSIDNFVWGTDGRGAENLIVKRGGVKYPERLSGNGEADEFNNIHSEHNLYMNGAEIFNFTLQSIPGLVRDVIAKNSLAVEDVSLYIFHQANQYLLNHLRKKIGIDEDRFFIHLKGCGNTVSSTIPIALHEALSQHRIAAGSKVLLAGFGVGYSWGGCTLTFQ